jgi:hypothetical protein
VGSFEKSEKDEGQRKGVRGRECQDWLAFLKGDFHNCVKEN